MANSKTEPLSEKGLALEFTNPRKFVVFLTVANSETDPCPDKDLFSLCSITAHLYCKCKNCTFIWKRNHFEICANLSNLVVFVLLQRLLKKHTVHGKLCPIVPHWKLLKVRIFRSKQTTKRFLTDKMPRRSPRHSGLRFCLSRAHCTHAYSM